MAVEIERKLPEPKESTTKYYGECKKCNVLLSCVGKDTTYSSYTESRYCICPSCKKEVRVDAWYVPYLIFLFCVIVLSTVGFAIYLVLYK